MENRMYLEFELFHLRNQITEVFTINTGQANKMIAHTLDPQRRFPDFVHLMEEFMENPQTQLVYSKTKNKDFYAAYLLAAGMAITPITKLVKIGQNRVYQIMKGQRGSSYNDPYDYFEEVFKSEYILQRLQKLLYTIRPVEGVNLPESYYKPQEVSPNDSDNVL